MLRVCLVARRVLRRNTDTASGAALSSVLPGPQPNVTLVTDKHGFHEREEINVNLINSVLTKANACGEGEGYHLEDKGAPFPPKRLHRRIYAAPPSLLHVTESGTSTSRKALNSFHFGRWRRGKEGLAYSPASALP